MDSLTLLAETSNSSTRPRSLRTDDNQYILLVRVHEEPDETFLQVRTPRTATTCSPTTRTGPSAARC